MRRGRRMSGSPESTKSPARCSPPAPARRSSIEDRRASRACPGRRAEGDFPMSDKLKPARAMDALAALTLSLSTPAFAAEGVKINDLVVAASIPDVQREATMKAVRAFYDFWNTGDEALLKEAIAPSFTTPPLLPGGRQGPQGPALASRRFRAAVPDLRVTVE